MPSTGLFEGVGSAAAGGAASGVDRRGPPSETTVAPLPLPLLRIDASPYSFEFGVGEDP